MHKFFKENKELFKVSGACFGAGIMNLGLGSSGNTISLTVGAVCVAMPLASIAMVSADALKDAAQKKYRAYKIRKLETRYNY